MIIRLADIDDEFVARGEMDRSVFSDLEENHVSLVSPVGFELKVRKAGDRVRIEGPIRCVIAVTCARCLDKFSYPMDTYLDIELAPSAGAPQATEFELRSDDLDVYYYEGDEIEIDPFVYDEVLLNVPVRPLCREDCAGLCQTCGKNRNYETCSCDHSANTALGEKLKSFLTK
ncbi:YceD family protein [Syntrophorhabdus aromaticivorans]|uniref:DUF177 domain-containing protein n=1 Tax=Syntrophorhabdus aromaticivorans TaxID=328301 RepID=A0A351U7R1_9BACT|nr:DUF177 domain-containing protein [Syntrophorhabdus aromaticivorans]NLW35361.1 DUF177 domain-containing protein [Syntrophorhabdus aromaticivorans]HBA55992.1 DUF177 domain-containing protein [Syntrophorhabdus aromaticivorans]